MRKIKDKKAQIWVETVIYTLIGLILIGTILAFATPAIQKQRDKAVISNTINSMNDLDNNILTVRRGGIANTRNFDFSISEGKLIIDAERDRITFEIIESKYQYSEEGITIPISGTNLNVITTGNGDENDVILTLDYIQNTPINITFDGGDSMKIFNPASTPYSLVVENKGRSDPGNPDSLVIVDIYEVSG